MDPTPTSYEEVLEAVMAGEAPDALIPRLQVLDSADRQALLCTVCSIHNEIASNSPQHGVLVRDLLESECPLHIGGVATCLLCEGDGQLSAGA